MNIEHHTCPPAYKARIVDYHGDDADDGWTVHDYDAGGAAEKAAARYEEDGEYTDEIKVVVTDGDGTVTHWTVETGDKRTYSATETTADPAAP